MDRQIFEGGLLFGRLQYWKLDLFPIATKARFSAGFDTFPHLPTVKGADASY